MALTAPRFQGDPILEACLAGTHRMLAPESGEAVRKVQEALIDLGVMSPLIGASGTFDGNTGNAVVAFKTARRIFPNDPVVGVKTMTALDVECRDKPPAPFSDRMEWLSWQSRTASDPIIGTFNFSRLDELNRRRASAGFNFDLVSRWLPGFLQDALEIGLTELLDPNGSPLAPGTPPATWGVGPYDLFHCHLALAGRLALPLDQQLPPPEINDARGRLRTHLDELRAQANNAPGVIGRNAAWSNAHRVNLLSSGVFAEAGTLADMVIAAGTPAAPALFVWHTFERKHWRPATMVSSSPQRSWQMALSPADSLFVVPFPFTPAQFGDAVRDIFEIQFLVSKTGMITAAPGELADVCALVGLVPDDVEFVGGDRPII